MPTERLPIDDVLPRLREALRNSLSVVLSAPPGAGKTTRVPLALLDQTWLGEHTVIMLEPRRLAARRAAEYMAATLGERAGATVGYRIRGESRTSPRTRIEVVTEGILGRMLHQDPALPRCGAVIFDEFHERSIHADLALALTLDVQAHLRPDLRIVVMSATLDGVTVAALLGGAPVLESGGVVHPVETLYQPFAIESPVEQRVTETVRRALRASEGDLLVFLPGRREINRVEAMLQDSSFAEPVALHTLYGEAAYERQRAALEPDAQGRRKVILATSIAETSLTIDGVRIVVDAGLTRRPVFDPRRGMSGLITEPVSKAAADQRRGRAGRQAPGLAYRLWTEREHATLKAYPEPEILSADLAGLTLDLALWGSPTGEGLRFMDPPPAPHLSQARGLLRQLGALDKEGHLTAHGRAMADIPAHPRLAHMILRGQAMGAGSLACEIAALLEERDVLSGERDRDVDLHSRIAALRRGGRIDRAALQRVRAQADRLKLALGIGDEPAGHEEMAGLLLSLAYPERIARRYDDGSGRYRLANGTAATLPRPSLLAREQYLAVGEVDGASTEAKIFLAAPVRAEELTDTFADIVEERQEIHWSDRDEVVVARTVLLLGAIVLRERPLHEPGDAACQAMAEGIRQMGLDALPWNRETRAFVERSEWLRATGYVPPSWPVLSEEALLENLDSWLSPFLGGVTRREHLTGLDLAMILRACFSASQLRELDRLAPSHLAVPGGSRVRIEYGAASQPVLAVKLQELFGETDTPRIAGGKVPLVLHLLSPAGRPLGVTGDLRSFWLNTYPSLRSQMRSRYPKHVWPDDPLTAKPTNRTARRKRI